LLDSLLQEFTKMCEPLDGSAEVQLKLVDSAKEPNEKVEMKKDTVSKQIITPDNPPLPDDVGGRAHEPSVFLSVKFNRLSVTNPQDQPSQTKLLPPSKSQICLLKRKSTKKCSRDKTLLRKSKLTKLFVNKSVVFGDSFSGGLENFSRLSLEKKEKGEKEDQEEFHGHAFTDQSRCAGKRKRSNTPEVEAQKLVGRVVSCGEQARLLTDINPDDLAGYLEDATFFPKKMSYMAEMMYT